MRFLILFFLFPLAVSAQDCKLKTEIDKFSQQKRLSTPFLKLSSVPGSLTLVADNKEIRILFNLGSGVCFDEQATAIFSFDSTRTKSNQKNTTSMNCDGMLTITFRNGTTTPTVLQRMTTHNIASITIINSAKEKTEIVLTPEEKAIMRERATCIAIEAKKLIGQ